MTSVRLGKEGRIKGEKQGGEGEPKLNNSTGHAPAVGPKARLLGHSRSCSSHVRHLQTPAPEPDDDNAMPDKVVQSPYPLIDADPHFSRVVRYMRPSDYAVWAGATAAFPSAIYFWGNSELSHRRSMRRELTENALRDG